jgi:hypothetical protein
MPDSSAHEPTAKPANRLLGRQRARGGQGINAVARHFVGRDIVPDRTGDCSVSDQGGYEAVQPMVSMSDMRARRSPQMSSVFSPNLCPGMPPQTRTALGK